MDRVREMGKRGGLEGSRDPVRVAARFCLMLAFWAGLAALSGCDSGGRGSVPDDEALVRARAQGLTIEEAADQYYPREIDNYFPGMDMREAAGVPLEPVPPARIGRAVDPLLTPESELEPRRIEPAEFNASETLGRNSWMLWCGGNEGFWDWLATDSLGFVDLLKLLDTRQRSTRFETAGLINEPGMTSAATPSKDEFGLWLDVPQDADVRAWREGYVKQAFAETAEGGKQGYPYKANYTYADTAYEKNIPPPGIYGLSSGVVGLRLFPNPNFDREAREKWDPRRYYEDKDYYLDPDLVRPYRVGMSCAFCHASWNPLNPPRERSQPEWANVSGNIGAQYLRIRAVFGNLLDEDNFVYHLLDSQPPGTIDTSLIASDNINNPNTMNSVFGVPQRVVRSLELPPETLSPVSESLPGLWGDLTSPRVGYAVDEVPPAIREVFAQLGLEEELSETNSSPRPVPRILLDGADSIGAWGALARVYLNIGTFWEQWNRLHRPVIGITPQKPFEIADCRAHSVYWHATTRRVGPMRDYFLKATPTMPLAAARDPGHDAVSPERIRERIDIEQLARGRKVFARNCIVCHSSIQPESRWAWGVAVEAGFSPETMESLAERREEKLRAWAQAGEFWDHDPGQWLRDRDYVEWAETVVETETFWRHNYLSTDYRVPVNFLRTNSARAMATNALAGSMWNDYASRSYQHMPSIGPIKYFNPYKGEAGDWDEFEPAHAVEKGVPEGGGGPGFYRVPTLLSIWATAPFLHNNSLGTFNNDPSVQGRLEAFEDAMGKMLWPERRRESSSYNGATPERLKADHGLIWRTPRETWLEVPGKYVAGMFGRVPIVMKIQGWAPWLQDVRPLWLPSLVLLIAAGLLLWKGPRWGRYLGYLLIILGIALGTLLYFMSGQLGMLRVGPIPAGTPVNLLANINPQADRIELAKAVKLTVRTLSEIESKNLPPDKANELLRTHVAPALIGVSKSPDFVMDRGHYFEWFNEMSDDDKKALIELLKTF